MSKIRVAAGLISSEAFLFASQTAHCLLLRAHMAFPL